MSKEQSSEHLMMSRRSFLGGGLASVTACGLTSSDGAACASEEPRGDRLADAPGDAKSGYIDAHVHVITGDTQRYPLKPGFRKEQMVLPSFTPQELFAHCRPCGVARIVLIQISYYGYDNSYMLEMMRQHAGVFSGVACIDEHVRPRQTMLELADRAVRGFRIVPGKATPERWLDDEDMSVMWRCGADRGLAMCPLIDPRFLPAVDRMCRRFPQTPVVIDHFARIGADGVIRPEDLEALCGLARHKEVRVKLSAFYALGKKDPPYLDLAPMIRRLLGAFGPERLMWASDSPFQVVGKHTYQASVELVRTRLEFLSDGDREWILRRTAEKVFFLGAPTK